MLKAVRGVFKWAIDNELAESNPARDGSRMKTRVGGFHSGTEDEARQYEATLAGWLKEIDKKD